MDNIILNIVSKKQNLSYPFVFSKIGKYYWNEDKIKKIFGIGTNEASIQYKWYKILKILIHTKRDHIVLFLAAQGDHTEVVKYLIKNGADICKHSEYLLHWAVYHCNSELVKILIENGADIHVGNENALFLAIRKGNLKIVEYLIENGANIHVQDAYGLTPKDMLHKLVEDHLEIIKYLKLKN